MKRLRKREYEHDPECLESAFKRRLSHFELSHKEKSSLPTPAPTAASPEQRVESSFQRWQTPSSLRREVLKQYSRAQSESKHPKRALEDPDCDQSAPKRCRQSLPAKDTHTVEIRKEKPQGNWFVERWLRNTPPSRAVQEKVEDIDVLAVDQAKGNNVIPTVDGFPHAEAANILVSQLQDGESTQAPGSAVSERLKTSNPMYRTTLKMNGVIVDNFGTKIPREVQHLVTKHMRKGRKSPRLGEEETDGILRKIEVVWDSSEPRVTDIIAPPLFPFDDLNLAPGLAQGGDIL